MGRAFVIRPFGTKKDSAGGEIDFDKVHRELIEPAVRGAGLGGSTTGEIVDAGNIRADMFALILEADLVVCDITILNANVFYELGIRHALRKKSTVMIKGQPTGDATPFDLLTDRYLPYSIVDPAAAKGALLDSIRASLRSDRPTDSPIFQMLPELPEADPENVQVVPPDFLAEVRRATAASAKGWLRLLSDEVRGQRFERTGLKRIGNAQWGVKDYEGARETWERVRASYPNDLAANLALANIYERLARAGDFDRLVMSDEAIERVLASAGANRRVVAEARALKGRNQKTHWRLGFKDATTLEERRSTALNRTLVESYESYLDAFREDLNHFYPGLNALQLGCILLDLSSEADWPDVFLDDKEAVACRAELQETVASLSAAVPMSIEAALRKLDEKDPDRVWAKISEADALFLAEANDRRVLRAYEAAFAGCSAFDWDAARGQLELFAALGYKAQRARAVIERVDKRVPPKPQGRPLHVVVFAGHQIDQPGRALPRFPAAAEARARELIKAAMQQLMDAEHDFVGFGSASPGADILWHEVCGELGLSTRICLPMPVKDHARIVFRDDAWRSRFLDLVQRKDCQVLMLSDKDGLPKWLEGGKLDPWARGNDWVLKLALGAEAEKITLLALWDGRPAAPGSSGTAQIVQLVRDAGSVRVQRIDSNQLLA
jgi:hypothetical protein